MGMMGAFTEDRAGDREDSEDQDSQQQESEQDDDELEDDGEEVKAGDRRRHVKATRKQRDLESTTMSNAPSMSAQQRKACSPHSQKHAASQHMKQVNMKRKKEIDNCLL
jgi:hypothetical protein